MRKTIPIVLLLLVSSLAWCQTDGKKPPAKGGEPVKMEFISIGSLQGKIEGPARENRVRVALTGPFAEVDLDARDATEKLRKQLVELKKQALATPKDSPERAKKSGELEKGVSDLQAMQDRMVTRFQVGDVVELNLTAQTAIRLSAPPGGLFDDKGNVRKFTRADLQKMRGPGKLPGFTGDLDSFRSGKAAIVTVFKKKPPDGKEKSAPDPGKNDLYAGMILLLDSE